jgi:hypothetical protein
MKKFLIRIILMFFIYFLEVAFVPASSTGEYASSSFRYGLINNEKIHDLSAKNLRCGEMKFDCVIDYKTFKENMILNQQELVRFYKDFGKIESNNNYDTVNCIGYCGRFQFGERARKDLGINDFTVKDFRRNPKVWPAKEQDIAMLNYMRINNERLRPYFFLINRRIHGVKITRSGLLAAAHLGGSKHVIEYLKSNGKDNFVDKFNTSVECYLKAYANYNFKLYN